MSIKKMSKSLNSQKGQSLVELLIVIGLCAVLLPALITGLVSSRSGKAQQKERVEAVTLLKEAEEAVRSIREKDWANLSPIETELHTVREDASWKFVNTAETINGFTRKVVISNVYRDSSNNIIQTGTTEQIDPSTKKVVISVAWSKPIPASVDSILYLTRYLKNSHQTETTDSEFNNGTKTRIDVTKTVDGELILGSGGKGDWCKPKLSMTEWDLPKQGVANAISAIVGRVFAATGENSSGVSFANVTVSNDNPPQVAVVGDFDGYKTNGIFGETNYAYLATDKKVVIIDLTKLVSGKYLEVGSFDLGNKKHSTVYVSGNIGFTTVGSTLYTFNLSSKTGSRPQLGSVSLGASAIKTTVIGNYVYVAIDSNSNQLKVYQYSPDGKTISFKGQITVNAGNGRDIYVNSINTTAYLATTSSSTKKELFIINVTDPASMSVLKSYDTGGMDPKGLVAVANGSIIIIVGKNGHQYQAVRIPSDSGDPSLCGFWDISSGVNGVSTVEEPDGDVYSYIITGDSTKELKIIEGGGGSGGTYAASGIFESQPLDFSKDVVFNRFFVKYDTPTGTDLQFQVAAADPGSNGCSNATYTFVGPDGTINSRYSDSGFIPWSNDGVGYENPARCFKYKAYFSTGDSSKTPTLFDFSVNYSP
jgi:type II secretory pathway pseudopilin PulG